MPIRANSPIPTTQMEVTSIRLERELKQRLKALAGNQGYQALIREILWSYVLRH
jgi:predicted DNA-binding protein